MTTLFLSKRSGLTLIELLIVVAILAAIILLIWLSVPQYISRSRDAVRKTHLEKYRVALEDYLNDREVYPPESDMASCGSTALQPYLPQVLCDPQSGEPYSYTRSAEGTSYELYAKLQWDDDPVIGARGCSGGCGPDEDGNGTGDYNYGIGSEQSAPGEGQKSTDIQPTCFDALGRPYCDANQCQVCCPGNTYRCNSAGTGCYIDYQCTAGGLE